MNRYRIIRRTPDVATVTPHGLRTEEGQYEELPPCSDLDEAKRAGELAARSDFTGDHTFTWLTSSGQVWLLLYGKVYTRVQIIAEEAEGDL